MSELRKEELLLNRISLVPPAILLPPEVGIHLWLAQLGKMNLAGTYGQRLHYLSRVVYAGLDDYLQGYNAHLYSRSRGSFFFL